MLRLLLFCLVASLWAPATQAQNQRRFDWPTAAGANVDHCATWAHNCGRGGADNFCRTKGYRGALRWATHRPGHTYVIGSRRHCRGNFCIGFQFVVCAQSADPNANLRHACFKNQRRYDPAVGNSIWVRLEVLDSRTGRRVDWARVFMVIAGRTLRVRIGTRKARWCWGNQRHHVESGCGGRYLPVERC